MVSWGGLGGLTPPGISDTRALPPGEGLGGLAPQESPLITRALPPQRPCLAPVPCPPNFFVRPSVVCPSVRQADARPGLGLARPNTTFPNNSFKVSQMIWPKKNWPHIFSAENVFCRECFRPICCSVENSLGRWSCQEDTTSTDGR